MQPIRRQTARLTTGYTHDLPYYQGVLSVEVTTNTALNTEDMAIFATILQILADAFFGSVLDGLLDGSFQEEYSPEDGESTNTLDIHIGTGHLVLVFDARIISHELSITDNDYRDYLGKHLGPAMLEIDALLGGEYKDYDPDMVTSKIMFGAVLLRPHIQQPPVHDRV